jgi:hypothetical protein
MESMHHRNPTFCFQPAAETFCYRCGNQAWASSRPRESKSCSQTQASEDLPGTTAPKSHLIPAGNRSLFTAMMFNS